MSVPWHNPRPNEERQSPSGSSRNAYTHGLQAMPDAGLVRAWFNIIRGNVAGHWRDPREGDPLDAAALRLALAEACYHRAAYRVETHDQEPNSPQQRANRAHEALRRELDEHFKRRRLGLPVDFDYIDAMLSEVEALVGLAEHEAGLMRRYFGEARSARRRALRDWCAFRSAQTQNPETNYFSI